MTIKDYKGAIRAMKRQRVFMIIALTALLCITILNTNLSPDLYFVHWTPLDDISCHYSEKDDALPRVEDSNYVPKADSIFFHETSCRGSLNSRQACAVESAARAHPDWDVYVLFSAPVTKHNLRDGASMELLQQFKNIKFARIHILDYAKGTPLESLVASGGLNKTRWRISHTSDALRYLTLYKFGGVYLDLDVVVAKPFATLAQDWAARESSTDVAAGAMALTRSKLGRVYADATIRNFAEEYRGDSWGHNGPGVITRILKQRCHTNDVTMMNAASCQGMEVYGPELFYPISWRNALDYFDNVELKVGDPYIYHVWNKLTEDYEVGKDSMYAKLAKKYCPNTFNTFGNYFGM